MQALPYFCKLLKINNLRNYYFQTHVADALTDAILAQDTIETGNKDYMVVRTIRLLMDHSPPD